MLGWSSPVYPLALLLMVMLPFEAIQPIIVTRSFSLTNEKLVLLLVAAAWLAMGTRALPTRGEARALLPSLALLAIGAISALLAPDYGDEALKSLWRPAAAMFGLLLAIRLSRELPQLRGLVWAIAIGAGASALLGLGEAAHFSVLDPLLRAFKVAPTTVAGELRVSASFQYATIAAMYFEMVVPLAIVLAATTSSRVMSLLGAAIALLCVANVALSLTRAGMLTLVIILGVLIAVSRRRGWRRLLLPTLASGTVLAGGVAWLIVRDPVFDMRLVSESDADWYGAAYIAPAALTVEVNQVANVAVDVRNEGRIGWAKAGTHPFALGYRWLTADGAGVLDLTPGEVPLPRDVAPGETIHLETTVVVPNLPAGAYRLDWGMLQRDVLQFYERGWANAETAVNVTPISTGVAPTMPNVVAREDGEAPWVVGRLDLWRAALRLFETRPLLGVGPDNFRHLYGAELGLEAWDERIQANNVYLEVLVDTGLLGLSAFLWVVLGPLFGRRHAWRSDVLTLGVALGVVAFLMHGLLDSFLAFTPTAMLLWIFLGALGQKPQVSGR